MAGRIHSVRRGASKRATEWIEIEPTQVSPVAGGIITHSMTAAELAKRPFTVVRTHLELMVYSDQAAAIEYQGVGVGACVVSEPALAIGITALPTPVTDMDSDLWFLHKLVYSMESNLTDRTRAGTVVTIDSKAMRKVNDGSEIVFVAELTSDPATGAVLAIGGRMLIKVH